MKECLRINRQLAIPLEELRFRFTRSGGPGGQNVNRTATRVELLFDVAHSPSLTEEQRALLLKRLQHEIDREGVLRLVSQSTASQWRNRQEALKRLKALLAAALRVPRKRIPTRPSRTAHEKRLQQKKRRSQIKRNRRRISREE